MIKRFVWALTSLPFFLILLIGWETDTFLYRASMLLVDDGIAIDKGITRLKKQSTSHQVFWRGDIENSNLKESSGLAASTRNKGVLWSINDSGSDPEIFALSVTGENLGKWRVVGTNSNDWEGMDSFEYKDRHYLLVGDTGNNFRTREKVSFFVLEEPLLDAVDKEVNVSWQTDFQFPDGPKDVEAVAVDLLGERVVLLNKRELPLKLYSVPLFPVDGKIVAEEMAELAPVPRYRPELEGLYGRTARYLGLPTGMDLYEDKLLVITYRNAYLYDYSALEEQPKELLLPLSGQREAITFGFQTNKIAYVSRERKNGTEVADIFEIILGHE